MKSSFRRAASSCARTRAASSQRTSLHDDRGLIGEEAHQIEVVLAEHGLVIGVRLESAEALVRSRDRCDEQRAHAVRAIGRSELRVRACGIRDVLGSLLFEYAPDHKLAWPDLVRQNAVGILEA